MNEPHKHLLELGLSESEISVYLAMVHGARSARELVKETNLKRPTVYYALGCLERRGLLSKTGQEGDKKFFLESPDRLIAIAEEKSKEAIELKNDISLFASLLKQEKQGVNEKPMVTFFEGVEAVKRVVMDTLYARNKQISSIVPRENFFHQTGLEFVTAFVSSRVARKITTKNLWEVSIDKKIIQEFYSKLSEIRILPKIMHNKFKTTIFLYDDKTLYVSSLHNSYCILITSQEHHDTMQAVFDGLWETSKIHPQ